MESERIIIAVFFTHGVSLELWEKRGILSREIRFYQELASRVGEIWFFTYGIHDAQFQKHLGPNIRLFPKRLPIPNLLYGLFFPIIYRKQIARANVIRIHQMAGAIPALIAHWFLKKPLIVRCGYQWSTFLKRQKTPRIKQWIVKWIERVTYQASTVIILTTQTDAQEIINRYKILPKKIHVIPNYVDTELFQPMHIQKEPRSICFVGRLEPQKNLLNLIEAVQGLNSHLIFYGEGSLKDDLQKRAERLGVRASSRGKIANENLPAALNACEVFILPSFYEGNPKVLLEAMSCDLPVIGTDVEGIREIIRHDENGILCETNSASMQWAMKSLLTDREKQMRLGRSARKMILIHHALPIVIEKEYEICLSIFNEATADAS